jgi:hypothetical protein
MFIRIILALAVIPMIAFIVAIVAIAASGDDDDGETATPTGIIGEIASCAALDELESYRYTVTVHIENGSTPTNAPEDEETSAPLDALGEALAQLLSDFSLNGSYVKPDRSQGVLTFGEDEIELRRVGDESWVRVGGEWSVEEASADDLLTPMLVCNEVIQAVSPSLTTDEPPPDGNIEDTDYYRLDPERSQNLPAVLGQELEGAFSIGLWIDQGERYPAKLRIESRDPDSDEPAFLLSMDVFDVGDDEIGVQAPQ